MIIPLLLLGVGAAAAVTAIVIAATADRAVPNHEPDISPPPPADGRLTGHFYVNKILDKLRAAASSSGIPLGLLVGWVAKESGGLLEEWNWPAPNDKRAKPTTSAFADGERGYFQLSPDESKGLGLEHHRLSQDPDYSIEGGIKRILQISRTVDGYGIAPKGSSFYWLLCKLVHTVGGGDVKKLVDGAKAAGQAGSWAAFKTYATGSPSPKPKHSPTKWFKFIDEIYQLGRPFGFGDESSAMVGFAFDDADAEALARAVESCRLTGTLGEKQAVAWAIRNRAAAQGVPVAFLLAPEGQYGPRGAGGRDYASTAIAPRQESSDVARAVLSLPDSEDPTDGALDFWCPAQQARLKSSGDARAMILGVESVILSVDEARAALVAGGLRPKMIVGEVELLGL